jgi:hypothetical protein
VVKIVFSEVVVVIEVVVMEESSKVPLALGKVQAFFKADT